MRREPAGLSCAMAALMMASGACATGDAGEPGAAPSLDLLEDGVLTVCTDVPNPPYAVEDPEQETGFAGFDVEVVADLAGRLGLEPRFVDTSFERIHSGLALEAGRCDVAAAALEITDERDARLGLTDPYHETRHSLLVAADGEIGDAADLAGRRVAVPAVGSARELAVEEGIVGPDDLVVHDTPSQAVVALRAGEVVAVLQRAGANAEAVREHDDLEVVDAFEAGEEHALAVAADRTDGLLAALDDALAALLDDPAYERMREAHFAT